MPCYELIEYESWSEFVSCYSKDIFGSSFIPNIYIFRGQRKADWQLISSFDRQYRKLDWKKRTSIETQLLENFKTYLQRENISINYSQIDSLAQHYGIPTRLLDWSYSPFIAAYFAFSSNRQDDREAVAIWALRKDHDIWNQGLGVSVKDAAYFNENIHQRKQLGCFTILKNQEISLEGFLNSCENNGYDINGALKKITIPNSEFKAALYELEAMGINAMSVYGGLEGCAQAAKDIVRLQYD